jgi:hypothetical protein
MMSMANADLRRFKGKTAMSLPDDPEVLYFTYLQASTLYHQGAPERTIISTIKAQGFTEERAQQLYNDILAGKKMKRIRTHRQITNARHAAFEMILTGTVLWLVAAISYGIWMSLQGTIIPFGVLIILMIVMIGTFGLGAYRISVGFLYLIMGWESVQRIKVFRPRSAERYFDD